MLFGVGASLARQLPATELRVLPAPSSLSLAAARLGWALQEVACLSLVARPLAALQAQVHDSHNPLIYKQRIVGDWEINGSEPPYVWQIGSGPATASR